MERLNKEGYPWIRGHSARDVILTSIPALLPYLEVTLMVGLISVVTGSAFGLLLAWARLSGNRILSSLAEGYTYIIRCTPSIVLLFIVFYGLPVFARDALGIDLDNLSRAIFVIITFTLLFGGFVSEVFRSAYLAVPKGQYEAAVTIGLSPWKAFLTVVMPQAAVIALPNFGNSVLQSSERKRPGLYDRAHRSPGQDESYHFPKLRRVRHRALCSVHADLLDGEYPS